MEYLGNKLRHEYKYYINCFDYTCLRNKLKMFMSHDSFADANGDYIIRSLYFDDIYNTALYEKNSGVFHRDKYRIRVYNFEDNVIKLERKSKFGNFTNKKSRSISLEQYNNIMQQNFSFMEYESGLLQAFYRQSIDNVLRPKVIVDYTREAYILEEGNVRITFDKDLRVGYNTNNIFDKDAVTIQIFDEPKMILEVKYDDYLPRYISEIVNLSYHNLSDISKYEFCRVAKNNIY